MPEGLITEIQREAINSTSSVSGLLRKVKLAAAKLKLDNLAAWVDLELNGYPNQEVPEYRRFSGQPIYWNQYHGWQPIGGNAEVIGKLSEINFGDSIGAVESLAEGKKGGTLRSMFPAGILQFLTQALEVPVAQAGAEFSRSNVIAILNSVRTAILDWAIEMEKAGVHGEGLSFSSTEQQKAQAAATVFNIGTIGAITGNLGVGNISGDITNSPLNIDQVRNLVTQIKSHAASLTSEGVDAAVLQNVLATIDKHLKTEKPALIRSALSELQKAIGKAAGGIVAQGVLAVLHHILGTGVPT